jgi:hypothetical protein
MLLLAGQPRASMADARLHPKNHPRGNASVRPELIAEELNRSVQAIKARAYTIGLPLKWFKPKTKG